MNGFSFQEAVIFENIGCINPITDCKLLLLATAVKHSKNVQRIPRIKRFSLLSSVITPRFRMSLLSVQ